MAKTIIGIMGPGNSASTKDMELANELGKLIAKKDWTLLTGGRNIGVMDAASQGAHKAGGLTVGILPSGNKSGASKYLDIVICTGMGNARNNINILSSDVVVGCGCGAGTASEIMLALKAGKPQVLLAPSQGLVEFIRELQYPLPEQCTTAKQVIPLIQNLL
jgi:uncharacterized protein (TIGR00725 family)